MWLAGECGVEWGRVRQSSKEGDCGGGLVGVVLGGNEL